MKTKKPPLNLLMAILAIMMTTIACRIDRFLNPTLPTFTPTIQNTPLPTLPPTPTPIPTPEPGLRIESGDSALWNGDYDRAIQEYSLALEMSASIESDTAALLGLGRTYYQMGDYSSAQTMLNSAIAIVGESSQKAPLLFTLAEVYEKLDQPVDAAWAFQEYLNLRPGLIDFYIYERIGDNQYQAQNFQQAIEAYLQAIQSPHLADTLYLNIKIADAYVNMGEFETALISYQDVYDRTANDFYKAESLRKIGDIKIEQGLFEEAYQIYQEVVSNFPVSYDAYLALVTLLDADQPVSDLDRGLINYFVQQYGFAVDALVRYLKDNPLSHPDSAHYYLGLSYLALGEYNKAINAWQEIVDEHVNERFWASAYDEIAYAQSVYLGKADKAIDTYLEFVDRSPLHERAPEFLYYAARTAERNNDLKTAARLWERIGTQFSTSTWAYDGLFQAGIARYRLGEYEEAISIYQSALGVTNSTGEQAGAYFWIGKCYFKLGNTEYAENSWLQATTSDPTGYYSERAADLLAGISAFSPPTSYNLNFNLIAERSEADSWMHSTFSISPEEDLTDYTPLNSDPRLIRGTELWNLGLLEAARAEFESMRLEIADNPANLYRLMNYLNEIRLYRSAIMVARQILNLAGYDDAGTFNAPIYFNHIRFGTYYSDIILAAAQEYQLEPLFLLSVIRQESLFEGFVTSTAGARGLMQIIPSTGQEIFTNLFWPSNYTGQDLYRPIINIYFGAYYLDRQRDYFNGDLYLALAAYNGGPGNAASWMSVADNDPDLFLEVIRFSETRNYIRSIYELFTIYSNIYKTE